MIRIPARAFKLALFAVKCYQSPLLKTASPRWAASPAAPFKKRFPSADIGPCLYNLASILRVRAQERSTSDDSTFTS